MTAVTYLPLSELSHKFSPYHLTNAALNIQNSRQVNQRGRDADFFLFSANYVGSDSTGYLATKDIEPELMPLDLGTAMAISGAAAASNMGANLRQWSTHAGVAERASWYWFPHPKSSEEFALAEIPPNLEPLFAVRNVRPFAGEHGLRLSDRRRTY